MKVVDRLNMSKLSNSRTKTEHKYFTNIKTWYRYSYIKNDGTAALYVYVYLKREKVVFNTAIKIEPIYWDPDHELIRRSHPRASELNLILTDSRARINDIFVRYKLQHMELTPQLLRKEYETPTSYIDFYDFLDKAIVSRKDELAPGTYKHHLSFARKFKKYCKKLTFAEIDREFILAYQKHLQNFYKNKPGTINQNFNKLKAYLNIARRQGIIRKNPFDEIRLRTIHPDREFLLEEELKKLIELYYKKNLPIKYQNSLNLFLFSCFTSLRISDVRDITMDKIVGNMLVYFPRKTSYKKAMVVKIPLSRMAKKLIKDASPYRIHGPIFHMPADQTVNIRLKYIMEIAGIDKKVSFHTARHTFATIFLRRTKNIMALKELLGHTNIRETMIYSHILTDDLVKEMKIFDELI